MKSREQLRYCADANITVLMDKMTPERDLEETMC